MSYDIETEVLHPPLTHLDIGKIAAEQTPWWNRTLQQVNDGVFRLAVAQGEFHWHKHDDQDELFLVVEGRLLIDIEGRDETVELTPLQAFTVPRGVVHRTRAPERTVMLMIEGAGVIPTGD